jgi:nucleoside-specific outer membrane channel protein Tsx
MSRSTYSLALKLCAAAALAFSAGAHAADWSDTEISVLHGTKYHDNGNDIDIGKTIITLQHASGYKYGRNFFFVDMLKSNSADNKLGEVYGEYYHTLSVTKLGGMDWSKNVVKDVGITGGLNYGSKNGDFGSNPKILLLGPTIDLNVPGFNFFNIDILAYKDTGTFSGFGGGRLCGDSNVTYQVTPAWSMPFSIGSAKFSFEGFVDFIGKHGTCARQILTQPQIRWDVGNHFGKPSTVFLGLEYQYWNNKFGIDGRKESLPQVMLNWKL